MTLCLNIATRQLSSEMHGRYFEIQALYMVADNGHLHIVVLRRTSRFARGTTVCNCSNRMLRLKIACCVCLMNHNMRRD